MSVAYCDISSWLLFPSLGLTIVALVLAWRDSPKASIICFGFVLLLVVVAFLTSCPSIIDPRGESVIGGTRRLRSHWFQRFLRAQTLGAASGYPHYPSTHPRGLRQIWQGLACCGALNRHVERVFNPDRKDTHWGKRKLARDR
jgi:hypothetical protein